MIKITFPLIS